MVHAVTGGWWTPADLAALSGLAPSTVRQYLYEARRDGWPAGLIPEPSGPQWRPVWPTGDPGVVAWAESVKSARAERAAARGRRTT